MRTVPSSRANSSKQSRVDPSESSPGGQQSKRSRSASEEPWDSSTIATSGLEIRGSESQIHPEPSSPSHQGSRPRRLTKVGISEREMRLSKQKTNIGGCMKICKSDMVGLKCIQTSCLRSILHEIKSSQT